VLRLHSTNFEDFALEKRDIRTTAFLTLTGIEGKMFKPMALTVVFALAGSLILSLT